METIMPGTPQCGLRAFLTGLYFFGGVAAAGSLASTLVSWVSDLNCLPPVTSSSGDPVSVQNALGNACDMIMYGSGVVCGLCFIMAACINCVWDKWGWLLCQQIVTLAMCVLCASSGTALTVDFVLWCHALRNSVETDSVLSCQRAASRYDKLHDTRNMMAYFKNMELQQGCQWAVVPFLLCAVVVCSFLLKSVAAHKTALTQNRRERHPSTGRYILLNDESAPLLETTLNVMHNRPASANGNQQASAAPCYTPTTAPSWEATQGR
ncbi:uncharacterized protein LOC143282820 isoform X2 [Babylonia areolata]